MARTIKEIIAAGELKEEFSLLLTNGTTVKGYLIQERVDKTHDTDGYNIYDMRSGHNELGIEECYATIEPNVMVDWSDSIATKQTLDFGEQNCLEVDNSDLMEDKDYVCQELVTQYGEFCIKGICEVIIKVYNKPCNYVGTHPWNDPYPERGLVKSVFKCDGHNICVYNDSEDIDFVEVESSTAVQ